MAKITAYSDNILCTDGDFGDQTTQAGIIIKSTIGKVDGAVPRWFKVFEVGPDVTDLTPGQWVYVEYGRWTEGMSLTDDRFDTEGNVSKVWKVDPKGCLAIADEKPDTVNIGDNMGVRRKTL